MPLKVGKGVVEETALLEIFKVAKGYIVFFFS